MNLDSIESTVLECRRVRLEPLGLQHVSDLAEAARHDEIWKYLDEQPPITRDIVLGLVIEAIRERAKGDRVPFAIIVGGKAIGSVSYIDIQSRHRALEIGWAWTSPEYWGSGVTREASYLLLSYAFDVLNVVRVAFKTDARNIRSQQAISGLGAVREGVLRHHRILRDGHLRDSVFYSFVREDWEAVRDKLRRSCEVGGPGVIGHVSA